ncbi:MAG: hypothetical protein K9G49_00550 [Taibaiella sp.]|nr:hypothetical protein [Taibaiella sp.]
MKIIIYIVLMCMLVTTASYGRQGRPLQRIHAAKMAYMNDRLSLSESQSGAFIPLYKEYEKELLVIRQPYIKKYKLENTDEHNIAARQYVEDDLDYQEAVIGLKRKYNDQFLKILSPKQVADMYMAEREFRQILMKRLKQERNRR